MSDVEAIFAATISRRLTGIKQEAVQPTQSDAIRRGFERRLGNGAQTASVWSVGIKSAAAQNMVAVGFIEKTLNHTISWGEWFVAAAPFPVLMTIALYFIMTRMMPAPTLSSLEWGWKAHRCLRCLRCCRSF